MASGGGVLGACLDFDIDAGDNSFLTLPDGSMHNGANCPVGAALAGQSLAWFSSSEVQGHWNGNGVPTNEEQGPGGGWQICFA